MNDDCDSCKDGDRRVIRYKWKDTVRPCGRPLTTIARTDTSAECKGVSRISYSKASTSCAIGSRDRAPQAKHRSLSPPCLS